MLTKTWMAWRKLSKISFEMKAFLFAILFTSASSLAKDLDSTHHDLLLFFAQVVN